MATFYTTKPYRLSSKTRKNKMQCLHSNNRRTEGILGTTREKIYQEFGLESLESRNLKSLEFFSFFFSSNLKK